MKNKEEERQIETKKEVKIETPQEVYEKQIPTNEFYFDLIKGGYSEERIKNVHIPIIENYLKDVKESSKPTVYLMMGAFGAGKGIIKKYLQNNDLLPKDIVDVDVDEVRRERGLEKDFDGYAKVNIKQAGVMTQKESSYLSQQIVQNLYRKKSDLIIDKSFSNYKILINTINKFKKAGYQVNVIMAYQTLENGLRNIKDRAIREGRDIDEKVSIEVYKDIEETTRKFIKDIPKDVSFNQYQLINPDESPIHHFLKDRDKVEGTAKIEV